MTKFETFVDCPDLNLSGTLTVNANSEAEAIQEIYEFIHRVEKNSKVKYKPWEKDPIDWEREHY